MESETLTRQPTRAQLEDYLAKVAKDRDAARAAAARFARAWSEEHAKRVEAEEHSGRMLARATALAAEVRELREALARAERRQVHQRALAQLREIGRE